MLKVKAAKLGVSLTRKEQRYVEQLNDALRTPRRSQTRAMQALVHDKLVDEGPEPHTHESNSYQHFRKALRNDYQVLNAVLLFVMV